MNVDIGNKYAIEGHQDPDGPPGAVIYRPLPGERVTSFIFPGDYSLDDALIAVVESLPSHMDIQNEDIGPSWIDGVPSVLVERLCQHYRIGVETSRPVSWGQPS